MSESSIFTKTQLENGITSYFRPVDVGYTTVYLQVPVGSAHNTAGILPGSFHFLEHVCFECSRRHSVANEFKRLAGSKGGWANAHTRPLSTTYEVSVPTEYLEGVLPGLFSAAFEPSITEEDMALQRGIIDNERRQRRWYPGNSELGRYLNTQWQWDRAYSLEQFLGGPEDLARISIDSLTEAHRYYLDTRIVAMAAGSGSIKTLQGLLEGLPVQAYTLPTEYEKPRWVRKEYHERAFRDVNRFELRYGGIIEPGMDIQTGRRLSFIFGYLTNSVNGPLYRWLREELGWVYGINLYFDNSPRGRVWTMTFPLGDAQQVSVVRQELWSRIRAALNDQEAITREVERLVGSSVYWDGSPDSLIQEALGSLENYGRIVTSADWVELIKGCADAAKLRQVFELYCSEESVGSMCAIPE